MVHTFEDGFLENIENKFNKSFEYIKIYINTNINSIWECLLYILYNLLFISINIYEYIDDYYKNCKHYIIDNHFSNTIYQIDYIDIKYFYVLNVYKLGLFNRFFKKRDLIPYYLDLSIINEIKDIINVHKYGFFKIKYYDNNSSQEILINFDLLRTNNLLFKQTNIIILNIIQSFIENTVEYDDKKLLYAEINNKTEESEQSSEQSNQITNKSNSIESIEITNVIEKYKNSFKINNINLCEFTFLLTILIKNFNVKKNLINNYKLLLTYHNLKSKIYNIDDYINFKTLYEKLAEDENQN